jgi:hypothetical protein
VLIQDEDVVLMWTACAAKCDEKPRCDELNSCKALISKINLFLDVGVGCIGFSLFGSVTQVFG